MNNNGYAKERPNKTTLAIRLLFIVQFSKKRENFTRVSFLFLFCSRLMLTLKLRIKDEVEPLISFIENENSQQSTIYTCTFLSKNFHVLSQIYSYNVRDIRKTCNFKVSCKRMKKKRNNIRGLNIMCSVDSVRLVCQPIMVSLTLETCM